MQWLQKCIFATIICRTNAQSATIAFYYAKSKANVSCAQTTIMAVQKYIFATP
jgi:hypothetical protein